MNALVTIPYSPVVLETLPAKAREDFGYWHELLAPLLQTRKISGGTYAALRSVARASGRPLKTVRNRYYRARKHGLLGLVDVRLCGPDWWRNAASQPTLSRNFIELWKGLCEAQQRNSANAHILLLDMWKKRAPELAQLPEYADFPGWPNRPRGWSYENLMRHAPSDFELAAARQGRFAAAAYRSTVYTTRVGLWVGSDYIFDDKWHDDMVNSFAAGQAGRPLEVYSMDLYSACKRQWGVRIRTKDQEGNYKGIAGSMMRMCLAATLFRDGYSPRGTRLLTELGTAKVGDALAALLHDLTGGLVRVEAGKMTGDEAHMGQYPALRRGNFRHKAHLESNNNLEHNRFQHLPGQTGRNVELRPDELDGRLTENELVLAAYAQLPEDRKKLLILPLLELNQWLLLASDVYAYIANDRKHQLEGWIEAGNILQEFSWGGQPLLETELNAEQRAQVPALLQSGFLTARPVRMSRREVWERGASELVRLSGAGVCAILGDDLSREVRCLRSEIEVQDAEISPSPLRYEPTIITPEGHRSMLRDGEIYQAFVNPFCTDTLFVRDAAGRYLGESRRILVASRADVEAVHRAIGAAAKREAELLTPLRARHMREANERLALHRANSAAADMTPKAPKPVDPESERGQANLARQRALAAAAKATLSQT